MPFIEPSELNPSLYSVFSLTKSDLVGDEYYTEEQWNVLVEQLVQCGSKILINTGETIFFSMDASRTTISTIGYELDALLEELSDIQPPVMLN